ncbi:DUF3857 domain-containing protein [Marinirhabdus gelatinilytica]|uniref:Uncharacterized protein DUF3857 n=1 Tax=Marinirhabdus gelatinilytica TaxID=1703343 RepID=A0A370Q7D0_9FLAO|nr:DUF3857 domain-containing transglutaminase family protein [Marinirhabdus gelatinilytica]RDK84247.1 uncharacterized protein DUF3857 [Marinirhabdus gelatinilytica]
MKFRLLLLFIFFSTTLFAQYAVKDIPEELTEGVNAVIRLEETVHELKDYNSMQTTYKKVVTFFNREGLSAATIGVDYDSSSSVKDIGMIIYDKDGNEIKEYKKRDFLDVSASGGTLYSDNRKLYVEHYVASYPLTCEFFYEKKSTSTAFLNQWMPSPYYDVSVEKSSYTIINEEEIPLTTRKYNLDVFNAQYSETPKKYTYSIANMKPDKREGFSPHFTEFNPVVKVALQKFQLVNETANIKNWTDFGLWQNNSLLKGRDKLSNGTKARIDNLVSGVEDPKEKTRLIYEYMQDKTRYVFIAIGIGGWQPTTAKEVDELSYGDCKGLTNYTKALLKSQGIESYYTIVDSGENGRDLDEDFVALQGNHVILTVPFEDENVFLECTSQELPFNYLGTHTDDRKALMVTPEGGVMIRTHKYETNENVQSLKAVVTLHDNLELSGRVTENSKGLAYNDKYSLETTKSDDVVMYYKNLWGHLNALSIGEVAFENNKDSIYFIENLTFSSNNYISKAGDRILLNPNIFNRNTFIPDDEENRKLPIQLRRGRTYNDEIEITLPDGYALEAIFDPIQVDSQFGAYTASIEKINESKIAYKRQLVYDDGKYPKEMYTEFRDFWRTVAKKDKSKIVLVKK